jgi:hypothetical protein
MIIMEEIVARKDEVLTALGLDKGTATAKGLSLIGVRSYNLAIVALGHIALLMPEQFKKEMKGSIFKKVKVYLIPAGIFC